jgi:hypothetical protein
MPEHLTAQDEAHLLLPGFLVAGVLAKFLVVLLQFQPLGSARFLDGPVVAITGFRAFEPDVFTHSLSLPDQNAETARLDEPGGHTCVW